MRSLLTTVVLLLSFFSFGGNKPYKGIDTSGNVLFTIEAEYVYEFSGGLARIKQLNLVNNTWVRGYGYINKKGELVIPASYEKAKDFVDGRAWVKKKNAETWTLINEQGVEIPTKGYKKVGYIMEGYSDRIAVYREGAMGWINRDGEEVIPCKYSGSSTFDKGFGLACVTLYDATEEKYGFINKNGETVLPFQYKQAGTSSFYNGYCRVMVNGRSVLINEKGEVVFQTKYKSLQNYSHGLMAVATQSNRKGWSYVNMKDELLFPGIYDRARTFDETGYATVEKGGKTALLDTLGNIRLDFTLNYRSIYNDPIKDGFICGVKITEESTSMANTPKDYYNASLELVEVGDVTLMSAEGSSRIGYQSKEGKRGFMDRDFKIVIPAKYSKATAFNDGIALVLE